MTLVAHDQETQEALRSRRPQVRARAAQDALAQGRFRDAVAGFKALLKDGAASEHTPTRRLALAEAYAGRARELTAKGIDKEALAIWENRAALGPEVPPAVEHAALKLRLGDPGPMLALWSRGDALPRDERAQIVARLGPRRAELAAALRGWSAEQLVLARELAAMDAALDAPVDAAGRKALLRLPQRHRDLLGADWTARCATAVGDAAWGWSVAATGGARRC